MSQDFLELESLPDLLRTSDEDRVIMNTPAIGETMFLWQISNEPVGTDINTMTWCALPPEMMSPVERVMAEYHAHRMHMLQKMRFATKEHEIRSYDSYVDTTVPAQGALLQLVVS